LQDAPVIERAIYNINIHMRNC